MDDHPFKTAPVQFPLSPIRSRLRANGVSVLRTSSVLSSNNIREQLPDHHHISDSESKCSLSDGVKARASNLTHALENYDAGNYLAAMRTCQTILDGNENDYEAQILLGRSLASNDLTKYAIEAFRKATKMKPQDHRGWKNQCDIFEASGERTIELFDTYLAILTLAKPSMKAEWNRVWDKMTELYQQIGGTRKMSSKLGNLKTFVGYPEFDGAVLSRWLDIVHSFPNLKFTSKAEESLMKSACRLVKDSPHCSLLDQMKCDILLSMTCKERWTEVEAKCLRMHRAFPSEKLPLTILAKQYIKTDMGSLQDRMIQIYESLFRADKTSPVAAIGRGQALLVKHNYESAIMWLSKGISLDKHNVYGWLYLSKAQLATNNHKEAYKSAAKGLELLNEKPTSASTKPLRHQLEQLRSQAALESNDCEAVIASITDWIPRQSLKESVPEDLYKKLIQACKRRHKQHRLVRNSTGDSLQDWKRGQRADYHLQQAFKYWRDGIETRSDPWMFLTSILKALKQQPRNSEVYLLLGKYLWEVKAEPSLAKEFLELAYILRPDDEIICSYLVDLCMVLQDTTKASEILKTSGLQNSENNRWALLRLGLILMRQGEFDVAENCFSIAINADDQSNRQLYECLGRTRLIRRSIFDSFNAASAFAAGAKLTPDYGYQLDSTSSTNATKQEAADIRAIYSDGHLWVTRPHETTAQFAFSILYAICPELLRPLGFDFNRVKQARTAIYNVYSGAGLHRGACNDFGQADGQCAYMLRWFLIHCQFIPQLLRGYTRILNELPSGNHIRVCCVGGGPGTDIIGLFSFLRSINRHARLTCHVLDKFTAWENIWKTIQPRLPPPAVNAEYLSLDITDTGDLESRVTDAVRNADIVTFVKSVSPAVAFLKQQKQQPTLSYQQYPFIPTQSRKGAIPLILSSLKSGALVIYIDNSCGDQNRLFLEMAQSQGLVLRHQMNWVCDISGNVQEYNTVWKGHGCSACESCRIQAYIFKKL